MRLQNSTLSYLHANRMQRVRKDGAPLLFCHLINLPALARRKSAQVLQGFKAEAQLTHVLQLSAD